MSEIANERYMRARMALEAAIDEFVVAANSVGFDEISIASSVLDAAYDVNPNLYKEMQRLSLPMVKEFELSKSLNFSELEKDWERAIVLWEQKQMWKVMNKWNV